MTKDDIPGRSGQIDQVASLEVLENATITGDLTAGSILTTGKITAGYQVGSVQNLTIDAAGKAANLTTLVTNVTTDGDGNLDMCTLPAGVDGQIKIIACTVEGAAGDTWKITPSVLLGGTQITFAGIGLGCILVYSAAIPGWIVVGNNGGTIS